jgi:hypothetical protein
VFNKKCTLPDGANIKNETLKSFVGHRPRTEAKTWDELCDEIDTSTSTKDSLDADALRKLYEYNKGLVFCVTSIKRFLRLMKAYHFSLKGRFLY